MPLTRGNRQATPSIRESEFSKEGIDGESDSPLDQFTLPHAHALLASVRDNLAGQGGEGNLFHAARLLTVGALSAGIVHELNNIHTPILGFLDLAIHSGACGEDNLRRLRYVRESLARSHTLMRRMLRFARNASIEKTCVPLGEIVQNAIDLVRHPFEMAGLRASLSAGTFVSVVVDEVLLTQAVVNLLLNARDAAAKAVDRRIRVSWGKVGGRAEITVEDAGVGMTPETRARLFEPFFTTKTSDGKSSSGTGLGLSVTQAILEAHGGGIDVRSEFGKGSRFTLWLPVREEDRLEKNALFPPASPATPTTGGGSLRDR